MCDPRVAHPRRGGGVKPAANAAAGARGGVGDPYGRARRGGGAGRRRRRQKATRRFLCVPHSFLHPPPQRTIHSFAHLPNGLFTPSPAYPMDCSFLHPPTQWTTHSLSRLSTPSPTHPTDYSLLRPPAQGTIATWSTGSARQDGSSAEGRERKTGNCGRRYGDADHCTRRCQSSAGTEAPAAGGARDRRRKDSADKGGFRVALSYQQCAELRCGSVVR